MPPLGVFFLFWLCFGSSVAQFSGSTLDCNSVSKCPLVHVVFFIDTSASVEDEAVIICDIVEDTIANVTSSLDVEVVFDVIGMARWGLFLDNANSQRSGGRYPCPGPPYPDNCDGLPNDVPSYAEKSLRQICYEMCANLTTANGQPLKEAFRCLTGDVKTIWDNIEGGALEGIWDWSENGDYQTLTAQQRDLLPGNTDCIWPTPPTCQNPGGCGNGVAFNNPFPNYVQGETEAYGSAGAVLAKYFPWSENSLKILIPVVDEGPCNGGFDYNPNPTACLTVDERWDFHDNPTSCARSPLDYEVIDVFKQTALEEDIVISTLQCQTAPTAAAAIREHGEMLANATGGFYAATNNSAGNTITEAYTQAFRDSITTIIEEACNKFVWSCEDGDPCTIRETCQFPDDDDPPGTPTECIGICICENNCEEVSSFSVPEDDVDVPGGNDGDDEATVIGAAVGGSVVALLLLAGLVGVVVLCAAVIGAIVLVAAILQATGVVGSGANVVAHAFVDNEASFNPLFETAGTEAGNPLYEMAS